MLNSRPHHRPPTHCGNCALAPEKCMRRMFTQQKLLTPSEHRSTDRIGWKPVSPPSNWPQQSIFEARRHNHFKYFTTSKLKTTFLKVACGSQAPLCGSQQSFNKTSSVTSPDTILFGIPPLQSTKRLYVQKVKGENGPVPPSCLCLWIKPLIFCVTDFVLQQNTTCDLTCVKSFLVPFFHKIVYLDLAPFREKVKNHGFILCRSPMVYTVQEPYGLYCAGALWFILCRSPGLYCAGAAGMSWLRDLRVGIARPAVRVMYNLAVTHD